MIYVPKDTVVTFMNKVRLLTANLGSARARVYEADQQVPRLRTVS